MLTSALVVRHFVVETSSISKDTKVLYLNDKGQTISNKSFIISQERGITSRLRMSTEAESPSVGN